MTNTASRVLLTLAIGALPACTLALPNDFIYGTADAGLDAQSPGMDASHDATTDAATPDATELDTSAPPDATRSDGSASECSADADCTRGTFGTVGRCTMGTCSYPCDSSHADCDGLTANGCEVDSTTDPDHCGDCVTSCGAEHAARSCVAGECQYVCDSDWADCDGTSPDCETMLGTVADCSGCGLTCSSGELCDSSLGTCVDRCDPPNTICGSSCVNIATSTAHCGACGSPCGGGNASWACVSRNCVVAACDVGFGDCDGDDTNGCETPVSDSLASCGACGRACAPLHAMGVCSAGSCGIAACESGWDDCDGDPANGCEVDLTALDSCGGCGAVCTTPHATPSCDTASCRIHSCEATWDDCNGAVGDGCETSLSTTTDCGGCGTSCARPNATTSCATGACQLAACDDAFADCNTTAADGCEVSLADDETNCGSCGHMCGAGTECVAGTCDPVIDAGTSSHSCAVRRSGVVECWGPNEAGQLGDGTLYDRGRPSPVITALRFDRVALGSSFTCGIERTTRRLHCWGRNLDGELGDGTASNRSSPSAVVSADAAFAGRQFEEVRALSSAACARDTMGEVWCWGRNSGGEVGDGTTMRAQSAVRVVGVSGALELAAGALHACARTATGVRCWGSNAHGALGDGSTMMRTAPVDVMGLSAPPTRITAGNWHTCALVAGGVWCWGRNDTGELGRSGSSSSLPIDNGVRADRLVCGGPLCFARTTSGWVGWGENGNGELGAGTETAPVTTPIAVPHPTSSTLVPNAASLAIDATGRLTAWGADWAGSLGVRDLTLRAPAPIGDGSGAWTNLTSLGVGGFHSFVVRSDERGYAAGFNNTLVLARATPIASAVPLDMTPLPSPVLALDAGRNFACGLAGSPAQVHCWGSASGIAASTVAVVPTAGTPRALGAGTSHVCVIVEVGSDRIPYCWGSNTYGQLGIGMTGGTVSTPTAVAGITDAEQLALGDAHTCVRRTSGAVACWGYGLDGRLGDGANTSSNVPVVVSGLSTAVDVASGGGHTCAVRMDGRLVCWGLDAQGQLGDGGGANAASPRVASLLGSRTVSRVAAGGFHGCAIADGAVFCWGSNTDGQLGLANRASTSTLVSLGLMGAVEIRASHNNPGAAVHTCARMSDGRGFCWGLGTYGRTATGEDLTLATPMNVLLTY